METLRKYPSPTEFGINPLPFGTPYQQAHDRTSLVCSPDALEKFFGQEMHYRTIERYSEPIKFIYRNRFFSVDCTGNRPRLNYHSLLYPLEGPVEDYTKTLESLRSVLERVCPQ